MKARNVSHVFKTARHTTPRDTSNRESGYSNQKLNWARFELSALSEHMTRSARKIYNGSGSVRSARVDTQRVLEPLHTFSVVVYDPLMRITHKPATNIQRVKKHACVSCRYFEVWKGVSEGPFTIRVELLKCYPCTSRTKSNQPPFRRYHLIFLGCSCTPCAPPRELEYLAQLDIVLWRSLKKEALDLF